MGVPGCGRTVPAGTENPGDDPGPAHRVDPRGSVVGLLTHAKVNNDIEGIVMEATTKCGRGHRQPVPSRRRRVHLLQLVDQSTHAGHLLEFTSTAVTVHPTP